MRIRYSKDVLENVRQAWLDYKAKTGITQTQAAKNLGIKQSAFSQYLRGPDNGGIPLNTDFLTKLANLMQVDPAEFGLYSGIEQQRPEAFTLKIKYTLSGATLTDKLCPVYSIVPMLDCYGVIVDIEEFIMAVGSIIIVAPNLPVREHDGVICKTKDGPVKVGQIIDAEDGWRIISPVWGNVLTFKADEEEIVHRIIGNYFPESKHEIYKRIS